jgi:hypothetical protein
MRVNDNSVSRQATNATYEEYVMNGFRFLLTGRQVRRAGTLDVINPATGGSRRPRPGRIGLSWRIDQ